MLIGGICYFVFILLCLLLNVLSRVLLGEGEVNRAEFTFACHVRMSTIKKVLGILVFDLKTSRDIGRQTLNENGIHLFQICSITGTAVMAVHCDSNEMLIYTDFIVSLHR